MNNFEKLVSIIMPAYNAEKYIEQSIESVINQKYELWELIIVNDCSTDSTAKILDAYSKEDERIKVKHFSHNQGVVAARNAAIEMAKGRFLAFLDSDDKWHPNKLYKQVNFMIDNKKAFTYTNYSWIDENSNPMNKEVKVLNNSISYRELLKMNYFGCLTVVVDLSVIKKPYFPNIKHEDYALWLDILKKYNIQAKGINENLAYYRITPGSISRNKLKSITWVWKIYRNHLKFNVFKSIYRILIFVGHVGMKYLR